ncbi:carbon-nitrogen hydrolase family protein [Bowmanella yangjiangensis]|uniref:Carbon-nitrogen hydrolase family protein n=1 Tax=Bowmanella yangjiangensis TaxID=2811230 RepID=A0ABS3CSG3_9ALTE|nr:carbon-nitrogen hydrolase family protein [Bowmanella yangjiangensis]MBN7820058.1 carbon-nitrogen hydrolase family protein [Bowmanella yangjiangensis]
MRSSIRISLAQISSRRGQIAANMQSHLQAIELAAQHHADILVFPELSLSGYELDLAAELAQQQAHCEAVLSQAAKKHNVLVIAGYPLPGEDGKAYIGALLCFPDGKVVIYRKQYLHAGEGQYCLAGDSPCYFDIKGNKVALAICADFANPRHAAHARMADVDIYLASALITAGGYQADSQILATIAKQGQCPVLLANFVGETGGWQACGQSAIWNSQGKQVFAAADSACLVLCDTRDGQTEARLVPI